MRIAKKNGWFRERKKDQKGVLRWMQVLYVDGKIRTKRIVPDVKPSITLQQFYQLAREGKWDEMEKVYPITDQMIRDVVEDYMSRPLSYGYDLIKYDDLVEEIITEIEDQGYGRFEQFGEYDYDYDNQATVEYNNTIKDFVSDMLDSLVDVMIVQQETKYEDLRNNTLDPEDFIFTDKYWEINTEYKFIENEDGKRMLVDPRYNIKLKEVY